MSQRRAFNHNPVRTRAPSGLNVTDQTGPLCCASYRRYERAQRCDNVHAFCRSDNDRVLAYHRWLKETGQDVASFAERPWCG
jgi:hypothetical protein